MTAMVQKCAITALNGQKIIVKTVLTTSFVYAAPALMNSTARNVAVALLITMLNRVKKDAIVKSVRNAPLTRAITVLNAVTVSEILMKMSSVLNVENVLTA